MGIWLQRENVETEARGVKKIWVYYAYRDEWLKSLPLEGRGHWDILSWWPASHTRGPLEPGQVSNCLSSYEDQDSYHYKVFFLFFFCFQVYFLKMNFYWSIVALHFLDSTVVKYPPALQEMQVPSLDWEDPLEKGRQPTPIFLPGEFHGQRSLTGYSSWGHEELDTT